MKVVTTAQMRELDEKAIAKYGIPGETLMDNAGLGVADVVDRFLELLDRRDVSVLLVAGRGNNGGDAFAAARHLKSYGYNTAVWLAGSLNEVGGDALVHLERMKKDKVRLEELPTKENWDMELEECRGCRNLRVDAVVDGVLGTGIRGPARGPSAGAINYINMLSDESPVIAIDVPSGLDSDTGLADGDAVRADVTVAMGLPKRGLVEPVAADHVGRLDVVDIGLPHELTRKAESDLELITASDVKALFAKRPRNSHKGDYGHLLILGGAHGYSGAVSMAARAATRSGVGLVTAVVPGAIAPVVAGSVPEAMVHAAVETETGSLAARCWPVWRERLGEFSAVLVGPGMTRHRDTVELVSLALRECAAPLVLDADALSVFDGRINDLESRRMKGSPLVITPHPGELGRMIGRSPAEIQSDRFAAAVGAADATGAVVVLKGAGTLVAGHGRTLNINMTGNPGMATGGTGDILAGLLGGMLAQGMEAFDAARGAVFLHGLAGDAAADAVTEPCVTAGDVIDFIHHAFRSVTAR